MKSFSSYLSGFIAGAAIASVVTLLTTPRTGEEMRTFLRQKGMEYRDLAETKVSEGQRAVSRTIAKAGDIVAERMEIGSEKLKEATEKVSQRVEEGSEKMKDKADEVRDVSHEVERKTSSSSSTYTPPQP